MIAQIKQNTNFLSLETNIPLDVAESILWSSLVYINAIAAAKKENDEIMKVALGMANVRSLVALGKATNTPVENIRRASVMAIDLAFNVANEERNKRGGL